MDNNYSYKVNYKVKNVKCSPGTPHSPPQKKQAK